MGSLGAILKHPVDIYPLLKLKMAAKHAEKQIPPEPHWAFCYSMLCRVSRSFALVIQQLDTELRNAVSIISIAFSCVICLVLISLSLSLSICVLGCDYLLIMDFFIFAGMHILFGSSSPWHCWFVLVNLMFCMWFLVVCLAKFDKSSTGFVEF